jgi:hypothetical protein
MRRQQTTPSSQPSPLQFTYFTTVLGTGQICPISERIGKRRVRSIAATSAEGRKLLRSGVVTIQFLDGRRFSGMPMVEIYDQMVEELQKATDDPDLNPRARADMDKLDADLKTCRAAYS